MVGQVLSQNYSYRTMVLNLLSFTPIPRRKALFKLNFSLTRGIKICGIRFGQVGLNYGGSQNTVVSKIFFTSPCPKTIFPPWGVILPLWRMQLQNLKMGSSNYTSPRPLLRHLEMPSLGLDPKTCISFTLSRGL